MASAGVDDLGNRCCSVSCQEGKPLVEVSFVKKRKRRRRNRRAKKEKRKKTVWILSPSLSAGVRSGKVFRWFFWNEALRLRLPGRSPLFPIEVSAKNGGLGCQLWRGMGASSISTGLPGPSQQAISLTLTNGGTAHELTTASELQPPHLGHLVVIV